MCDYHQLSAADCAPADENIVKDIPDAPADNKFEEGYIPPNPSKDSNNPNNVKLKDLDSKDLEDGASVESSMGDIHVFMTVSGGSPLFMARTRTHRGRICLKMLSTRTKIQDLRS